MNAVHQKRKRTLAFEIPFVDFSLDSILIAQKDRNSTKCGMPKAPYFRQGGSPYVSDTSSVSYYKYVREHHIQGLFQDHTHMNKESFDSLLEIWKAEIDKSLSWIYKGGKCTASPTQKASTKWWISIFYLHCLSGLSEGGMSTVQLAITYGISPGTVSN